MFSSPPSASATVSASLANDPPSIQPSHPRPSRTSTPSSPCHPGPRRGQPPTGSGVATPTPSCQAQRLARSAALLAHHHGPCTTPSRVAPAEVMQEHAVALLIQDDARAADGNVEIRLVGSRYICATGRGGPARLGPVRGAPVQARHGSVSCRVGPRAG